MPEELQVAEEVPAAETPEPEPVKLLTPPLGQAPKAPRVTKSVASEEAPPAANGFPAATEALTVPKSRRRKRKKRHAAHQQPV